MHRVLLLSTGFLSVVNVKENITFVILIIEIKHKVSEN